jgi:hypothetical protein
MYRCTNCNNLTLGRKHTPGKLWIEVILWLMFLLPGFLYSLWRLSGRRRVCDNCGNPYLIKIEK